jgi:hypothetical protein
MNGHVSRLLKVFHRLRQFAEAVVRIAVRVFAVSAPGRGKAPADQR